MSVEVKNGGRTDFVCDGCGEIITKGTAHLRAGNSPEFLRFHNAKCEAKYNKAKKVDAKAEKTAKKTVAPVEVEAPVEPEVVKHTRIYRPRCAACERLGPEICIGKRASS